MAAQRKRGLSARCVCQTVTSTEPSHLIVLSQKVIANTKSSPITKWVTDVLPSPFEKAAPISSDLFWRAQVGNVYGGGCDLV